MTILRDTHTSGFTIVSNKSVAQNNALSFRARGLLLYLLSLPDDWVFNMCAVTGSSPRERREAVASARRELERNGHVRIIRTRSGGMLTGTDWVVSESAGALKGAEKEDRKEGAETKFEKFWEAYGQVGSRAIARKAHAKALKKIGEPELLEKAQLYRESCRRNGVYQKHAATWLLNECWEDDCGNQRSSREAPNEREEMMSHEEAIEEIRRNCRL
jgi:hypothetical protein